MEHERKNIRRFLLGFSVRTAVSLQPEKSMTDISKV